MTKQPVFFLSHGGGPWPWLDGPFREGFALLEASLQAIPAMLPARPRAVLVISGHWEEPGFTVSTARQPGMVYDYYGFPEHTYHISYPAPGSPEVAHRVIELAEQAGIPVTADPSRGFDHGTFSMLQPIYPEAEVPVVSLAMRADYDVDAHLALGSALAPLREEGVVIVGSGFTWHDLRRFDASARAPSAAFDGWLRHALTEVPPAERERLMRDWEQAPSARDAHPREDHLIPLMVAVGAAQGDRGSCIYAQDDLRGGITASSYRFAEDVSPSAFDRLRRPA